MTVGGMGFIPERLLMMMMIVRSRLKINRLYIYGSTINILYSLDRVYRHRYIPIGHGFGKDGVGDCSELDRG